MTLAKQILSIALLLLLVGCSSSCSSDGPVAAKYSPAECPPAAERAPAPAETTAEEQTSFVARPDPEPIELGEEYDIADEPSDETSDQTDDQTDDETDDEMVFRSAPGDTIDLNTASEMELTKLTGVGPALAGRIVDYREKRRFEDPSEIRRVRGIGPAKYEKLKEQISVGD